MTTTVLARRFLRSTPPWRCALPAGVTVALLFAFNVFLSSQTLDAEATADSELGSYAMKVTPERLNQSIPLGDDLASQLAVRTRQASPHSTVTIGLFDFTLPNVVDDGLQYLEADWTSGLSRRYVLDSGSWPDKPGEIVLVGVDDAPRIGTRVKTIGSTEGLLVVGHGHGQFRNGTALLAGVGTWGSLTSPDNPRLAQLAGSATFYLPPGTSPAAFAARVEGDDPAAKAARGVQSGRVETRAAIAASRPNHGWTGHRCCSGFRLSPSFPSAS